MRYLMLVLRDPEIEVTPEVLETAGPIEDWLAYAGDRRVLGNPIAEPDQGRTVRVRAGEVVLSDGPYAETKEFLAGFDLLECDSLEEAVDIASRHPVAHFGSLDVRAFAG
jgi:hypothetical protein